jgi:hypothetical protein
MKEISLLTEELNGLKGDVAYNPAYFVNVKTKPSTNSPYSVLRCQVRIYKRIYFHPPDSALERFKPALTKANDST